jgi:hypothetical protein
MTHLQKAGSPAVAGGLDKWRQRFESRHGHTLMTARNLFNRLKFVASLVSAPSAPNMSARTPFAL